MTTLSGPLLMMPVRDSLVDEKEMIQIGKVLPGLGSMWPAFSPDGPLSTTHQTQTDIYASMPSDCRRAGNRRADRWQLRTFMKRMRSGTLTACRWAPTRSCC